LCPRYTRSERAIGRIVATDEPDADRGMLRMAPQPLVWVHGAGPQVPPPAFKHEADTIVFGRDMASTRLAYYADVRWPPPTGGGPAAAPARTNRARRVRAIRSTMDPAQSPEEAAASIVDATLTPPTPAPPPTLGGRGAVAASQSAPSRTDVRQATRLVEQLYREADRVAARSPSVTPRGAALGISFPDPIFRFVVGKLASDAVDYLYGPYTEAMRAPVRAALLETPTPRVIVAHSLGSVIAYDVLSEPALAGLQVDLWVTLGSPLGIGNIQSELRDGAGRPNPVPTQLSAWDNFADRFDPVAIDATLRNEFRPPKDFAHDEAVNNRARNNHDMPGYLAIGVVRDAIVAAAR
jgi:hypothetical protein